VIALLSVLQGPKKLVVLKGMEGLLEGFLLVMKDTEEDLSVMGGVLQVMEDLLLARLDLFPWATGQRQKVLYQD